MLAVNALLAMPGRLVVSTSTPFTLTSSHVPNGLYTSVDKGVCWKKIDDGGLRYEYLSLAYAPTSSARYLLVSAWDWQNEPHENRFRIWSLNLTDSVPKREVLWTNKQSARAFIVEGVHWYAATRLGRVVQGTLDIPAWVQELPYMLPCFLSCDVGLASDRNPGPPLLLANGRVFRLQKGPWWRRIWP
jgi:hypothetical protein